MHVHMDGHKVALATIVLPKLSSVLTILVGLAKAGADTCGCRTYKNMNVQMNIRMYINACIHMDVNLYTLIWALSLKRFLDTNDS